MNKIIYAGLIFCI